MTELTALMGSSTKSSFRSASDRMLDSSAADHSQLGPPLNIGSPWTVYVLEKRSKFDEFLEKYQKAGSEYGYLLLEKFGGNGRSSQRAKAVPLDTIVSKTESYTEVPMGPWNNFELRVKTGQSTLGDMLDLEEEAEDDEMGMYEFQDVLQDDRSLGTICEVQSTPPLRKVLQIGHFQLPSNVPEFQCLHDPSKTTFLDKPTIQLSTAGAPVTVRTPLAGLAISIYLYRGAARTWFVIPPTMKKTFEEHIRLKFFGKLNLTEICSQFVRHVNLWLDTTTLEKWGIEYKEVRQEAGQLLVLLPGSYYWGFSHGFGILEIRYFAEKSWTCKGYRFCRRGWEICTKERDLQFKMKTQNQWKRSLPDEDSSVVGQEGLPDLKKSRRAVLRKTEPKLKVPSSLAKPFLTKPSEPKGFDDMRSDEDESLVQDEAAPAHAQKLRRTPSLHRNGDAENMLRRRRRTAARDWSE